MLSIGLRFFLTGDLVQRGGSIYIAALSKLFVAVPPKISPNHILLYTVMSLVTTKVWIISAWWVLYLISPRSHRLYITHHLVKEILCSIFEWSLNLAMQICRFAWKLFFSEMFDKLIITMRGWDLNREYLCWKYNDVSINWTRSTRLFMFFIIGWGSLMTNGLGA